MEATAVIGLTFEIFYNENNIKGIVVSYLSPYLCEKIIGSDFKSGSYPIAMKGKADEIILHIPNDHW